jgi:hypothetical protein
MGSADPVATLVTAVTAALDAGRPAERGAVAALAATTDVLGLGALADDARRARHQDRTTFVRVHTFDLATPLEQWTAPPPAATEVRLAGHPKSLDAAVTAVRRARTLAGPLVVRGFWLSDLEDLGAFAALREAGLDEVAFAAPGPAAAAAAERARAAGLAVRVVAADTAPASRVEWLIDARALAAAIGEVTAVSPLPQQVDRSAPTTGFDDVRTVALCRLLVPAVPTIQVDWQRYGPKLAQVALGVGADDLDNVLPVDDAALGPRRVAVEEVRRNVTAAGLVPVERDGRWTAPTR